MIKVDSFRNLLFEAHTHFGDKPFLFDDPLLGRVSYSDVLRFATGLKETLDQLGVAEGDTVATIFHNCGMAALLFLGVIVSGRIVVPLNPASPPDECEYVLSRANCETVIMDPGHVRSSSYGNRRVIPIIDHRLKFEQLSRNGHADLPSNEGDGPVRRRAGEIVFTSGSTGRPKGVVLSELNLLSNAHAIAQAYDFRANDRFLTVCPLFHNSGQVFTTLACALAGGSTVAVKSDLGMVHFWSYVERYRPQWSFVMSSLLAVLLADRKAIVPEHARMMRGMGTGGAAIDGPMIARFESRFGVPVRTVYGLTETASIATCEPINPEPRSLGSSGRPLPICEVRIDPAVTSTRESVGGDAHVRGEIIICGPTVFDHYIGDPEMTQLRKREEWLRTGDVGYFDENGNLFVIDRLDSMLIVSGEKVYPAEIERLCASLPGAAQIVLAGVSHPILGTELVLVYRAEGDKVPPIRQWQQILAGRVTGFKLPKRYVSLADLGLKEFPTTSNGKLDRRSIAALVTSSVGGEGTTAFKG